MAVDETSKTNSERREYFRLEDDVGLQYRLLDVDEVAPLREHIHQPGADKFMSAASFEETSRQLRRLLSSIREHSSNVGQAINMLDAKLNLLSQLFVRNDYEQEQFITQQVNLSAGGIGFFCEHPLEIEHMYELKIILLSSNIGIKAIGKTVQCEGKPDLSAQKPYYIAFEFVHIREADRDIVVRHLITKQTEQRMSEKAQEEGNDKLTPVK